MNTQRISVRPVKRREGVRWCGRRALHSTAGLFCPSLPLGSLPACLSVSLSVCSGRSVHRRTARPLVLRSSCSMATRGVAFPFPILSTTVATDLACHVLLNGRAAPVSRLPWCHVLNSVATATWFPSQVVSHADADTCYTVWPALHLSQRQEKLRRPLQIRSLDFDLVALVLLFHALYFGLNSSSSL